MKKNNYFILLLSVCMIGCSVQTKQNKEQENIVKRDTACVIEPFLRDGITYICKDEIMKPYLVDYNYSPPQKYEIDQITAKKQGNKIIVELTAILLTKYCLVHIGILRRWEILIHFLKQS